MNLIIDSEDKLKYIFNDKNNLFSKIYVEVILSDISLHYKLNEIMGLYLCFVGDNNSYIISFGHSETKTINKFLLNQYVDFLKGKQIYISNKKYLINFFEEINIDLSFINIVDIGVMNYLLNNNTEELLSNDKFKFINLFAHFKQFKNLIYVIPIVKIFEHFDHMYLYLKKMNMFDVDNNTISGFNFYNNIASSVFYNLEKSGIKIDFNVLSGIIKNKKLYNLNYKTQLLYSNYNYFTKTSRPSNTHSNFNLAALKKEDDTRKLIVSKFGEMGKLVYFDYDAFHIRLIAMLIECDLPIESIHEYFGKYYFKKDMLTDVEYQESKKQTFQYLYGYSIPQHLLDSMEFFKKLSEYYDCMYSFYEENGYINALVSDRKILEFANEISDINKMTLFNYFIQNLETEINISTMSEIFNRLRSYSNIELVLYTYDSFLFDMELTDENLLFFKNEIVKILCKNGLVGKLYIGDNYKNLDYMGLIHANI